jgi:hypothetical protein
MASTGQTGTQALPSMHSSEWGEEAGPFVDAVHRSDLHAVGVLAVDAGLGDDVRHRAIGPEQWKRGSGDNSWCHRPALASRASKPAPDEPPIPGLHSPSDPLASSKGPFSFRRGFGRGKGLRDRTAVGKMVPVVGDASSAGGAGQTPAPRSGRTGQRKRNDDLA